MNTSNQLLKPDNITLSADSRAVVIIDQTKLPSETVFLTLQKEDEFFEAIYRLKVRGAPAIGIFAAYAMYVLAAQFDTENYAEFSALFDEKKAYLNSSRPTAVNLSWALERMSDVVKAERGKPVEYILSSLKEEAVSIQKEDIAMCKAISEYGLTLLKDGDCVITHCNAGPLATSCYGTALGPILLAKELGINIKVFADETRPLLQGARLTAYELEKAGVDVTLICDNMASNVMKNGFVSACFVGCDRVAANGDVANKIGTSGLAIIAKHYNVPFYVLGPSSSVDFNCPTGDNIEIELRKPEEIKEAYYKTPVAPAQVKCYNPAFDVTDNSLITAIVTEKGIIYPPFDKNLAQLRA